MVEPVDADEVCHLLDELFEFAHRHGYQVSVLDEMLVNSDDALLARLRRDDALQKAEACKAKIMSLVKK
jgi:hypothetical protein